MKLSPEQKQKVLKQIDFYFGDSNLPFDKFLKTETKAEGGWVDLSVVIAFSRMQSILEESWKNPDAVSDDAIESVGAIMRESTVVEISEDGYQIRRRDMPTDWTEVIAAVTGRTVHVALLPYDTTLEKLAKYFSKHGQVHQVRLLKYQETSGAGVFRGTALVEMGSGEEATALLSTVLPYEGVTLRVQTKTSFDELMGEARKTQKEVHSVDVRRPVVTVDGLAPDPEPVKQEPVSDSNPPESASVEGPGGVPDSADQQSPVADDTPYVVKDDEKHLLVHFDFLGDPADLGSGKALRDLFGGQTKGIRFVEHTPGSGTGVIRFTTQDHAQALLQEGGDARELTVSGKKFKLTLMSGDEEAAMWQRIRGDISKREAAKRGKRPYHAGRGAGGRHAKRGRR